ncbi:MAG: AAA family ATPase [Bacteroidia bacterium]|nr:AAA family ATPase [Bacteroidia bacterium]
MKKYPIGIQDFAKLREGGYLYVDKTREIFELIRNGSYFFLSRPRRFGKSLLLSTLKYLFEGRRELFSDLWVAREADYDWVPHPVLHFSFSSSGYKDIGLEPALLRLVEEAAKIRGISLYSVGLSGRFRELIQALGSGTQKLVILIDEYDKPLIDYIEDIPQAETNRDILKNFFSVVKDADPFIRFFLITGVSKFSKVSLFSDLNHLEDLTLNPLSATLTGYAQTEMESYFSEEIDAIARENDKDRETVLADIRRWYNGYRWWGKETLYNPFSVLNLMKSRAFRNYWWDTGTPTFLLRLLRKDFQYDFSQISGGSVIFESFTLEKMDWRSLMFQTGYLTIKTYDPEYEVYTLGYPNREVKDSMFQHLLAEFREGSSIETKPLYANIHQALDTQDMPRLMQLIDTLFATIPYQIFDEKREGFFHAVLHLTFQGLGLLTYSEVSTAKGRVDTVIQSKAGIYVMEFKLDAPAEEAMTQIREKRYGPAWVAGNQPVTAVAISFSSQTRSVAEWKVMPYAELLSSDAGKKY